MRPLPHLETVTTAASQRSIKQMRYIFLVSALGAIAAVAIAMFGIQTWAAMKVAPFIGALTGFAVGIATLKLRGLPLDSTFEEYKAAGKYSTLPNGAPLYINIALKNAAIVSVIEAPLLFVSQATATIVFPAGWIVMCVGTFYEVWKLNQQRLLDNDLDVFKLVAGTALIGIVGSIIYLLYPQFYILTTVGRWDLMKSGFIFNLLLSSAVAVLAYFGIFVARASREMG